MGGDLNEILWNEEKHGGSTREQYLINNFHSASNDCALLDLGFLGNIIWCNKRDPPIEVSLHLDRYLANVEFMSLFPNNKVNNRCVKSNHRPIKLVLCSSIQSAS